MSATATELKLSYEDYLALERTSGLRFEWLDGRVTPRVGDTLVHGALAAAAQVCFGASFARDPRESASARARTR